MLVLPLLASPTAPPTRTPRSPLPRTAPVCFPCLIWAELGPQRCPSPHRRSRQVEPSPTGGQGRSVACAPARIQPAQHSNLSPLRLPQSPWPTRTSARSASSSPTASSTRSSMRYEYAPARPPSARALFFDAVHTPLQGALLHWEYGHRARGSWHRAGYRVGRKGRVLLWPTRRARACVASRRPSV